MITLTLDYTCVIDLGTSRQPWVDELQHLLKLHRERRIDIAIPASAAAENQPGGGEPLSNYGQFQERLAGWSLAALRPLSSPAVVGASFVGLATVAGENDVALIERLKGIVHPDLSGGYQAFCERQEDKTKADRNFRNKTMDVMAILAHIHHRRDIFVARDDKAFFRGGRRDQLIALGAKEVMKPCCAYNEVLKRLRCPG